MTKTDQFNIVLSGVGGQGTLLAAEILGTAAVKEGQNVRVGEIHGMAQRGGAVVSTVRIGRKVQTPTVLEGQADVLVGFEPIEVVRNLRFASEETLVLMSDKRIPPSELAARRMCYPDMNDIVEKIRRFTGKIIVVETENLAREAGSTLTQNTILVGALSAAKKLPVKNESLIEAIRELVPARHVNVNVKAFKLGFEYVKKMKMHA